MQVEQILRISRVVSDLDRAVQFYSALGFTSIARGPAEAQELLALGAPRAGALEAVMRLGAQELALVRFAAPGRAPPEDSRSNDLWFQHLAIVVSDMQAAHAALASQRGWRPIGSGGPQRLPPENGGVQAFKFRDPDDHPLELLWFPPGQGRPVWHEHRLAAPPARPAGPFLGIDHSALAVSSAAHSVAFYESLGMHPGARSLNEGPVQSHLDGLDCARVQVTALRPPSTRGPGIELLAYQPPGRPAAFGVTDLTCDWITLAVAPSPQQRARSAERDAARSIEARAMLDPDGHRLVLIDAMSAGRGRER
ncbi:MAG TPA: VOC family protein [Steroidobacteraceae bacterium]|nr:VOC family protein [Steroidobacteraceae bacterium]